MLTNSAHSNESMHVYDLMEDNSADSIANIS